MRDQRRAVRDPLELAALATTDPHPVLGRDFEEVELRRKRPVAKLLDQLRAKTDASAEGRQRPAYALGQARSVVFRRPL